MDILKKVNLKKDDLKSIKVVVVDVDGTLLNSQGELSSFSREVIGEYILKGGHFILATGKLFKTIYPLCKELSLRTRQIVANGSIVVDPKTQELEILSQLSTSSIKFIVDTLKKYRVEFVFYKPERIYYKKGEVKSQNLDLIISGGEDRPLSFKNFDEWNFKRIVKILSFVYYTDISREKIIREEIQKFNEKIQVIRSCPYFLEFLKGGTSKLSALKVILKNMGVDLSLVVAFGDHENDIDLLREAKIGVAVANASSKVKKVADCITLSNDHDGVARFIEKFIL